MTFVDVFELLRPSFEIRSFLAEGFETVLLGIYLVANGFKFTSTLVELVEFRLECLLFVAFLVYVLVYVFDLRFEFH